MNALQTTQPYARARPHADNNIDSGALEALGDALDLFIRSGLIARWRRVNGTLDDVDVLPLERRKRTGISVSSCDAPMTPIFLPLKIPCFVNTAICKGSKAADGGVKVKFGAAFGDRVPPMSPLMVATPAN